MSPDNVFAFMALSIPIIAIVGGIGSGIVKRGMKLQERQMELAALTAGEQAAQYAAKIERLEAHVAVLNRIVTDKGTDLSNEIEALRGPGKTPASIN
jgi:type III secretory pathway component EscV